MTNMTQSDRQDQITDKPKPWWQRVAEGEQLPDGPLIRKSKCDGTVEATGHQRQSRDPAHLLGLARSQI